MLVSEIDMELVRQAFISGANNISNQQEKINELNVFPVPDGDTGTNMTLTIMSAVAEVKKLDELIDELKLDGFEINKLGIYNAL